RNPRRGVTSLTVLIGLLTLAALWIAPSVAHAATGACCIERTCTQLTPDDCSARKGSYKGDGVPCDPSPCDPPPPTGACCIGGGPCSGRTQQNCTADGGEYRGDGSTCDPDPCSPPPPTGACCINGKC